jgi:hypothetical protein
MEKSVDIPAHSTRFERLPSMALLSMTVLGGTGFLLFRRFYVD